MSRLNWRPFFMGTVVERWGQDTVQYEIRPDINSGIQECVYAIGFNEESQIPTGARVKWTPGHTVGLTIF